MADESQQNLVPELSAERRGTQPADSGGKEAGEAGEKAGEGGGKGGDAVTTVLSLRKMVADFVAEREWGKYHTPRNLAASVSVEAGELLELFQWLTPEEAVDKSLHDKQFRTAVGEELCDVLMYLMSLANALDLDVASIVQAKMAKNRTKYPADQFRGHYQRPLPS